MCSSSLWFISFRNFSHPDPLDPSGSRALARLASRQFYPLHPFGVGTPRETHRNADRARRTASDEPNESVASQWTDATGSPVVPRGSVRRGLVGRPLSASLHPHPAPQPPLPPRSTREVGGPNLVGRSALGRGPFGPSLGPQAIGVPEISNEAHRLLLVACCLLLLLWLLLWLLLPKSMVHP